MRRNKLYFCFIILVCYIHGFHGFLIGIVTFFSTFAFSTVA